MTITKTCVLQLFITCLYILFFFLLERVKLKKKSMEGYGIAFYDMCKKMLTFFFTPMYFDRG